MKFSAFFLVVAFIAEPAVALPIPSIGTSFDFGSVAINNLVTENFTVTPDAGYTVTAADGAGVNDPFGFYFGNCSADSVCNVSETFDPSSIKSFSGTTKIYECPDVGGDCIATSTTFTGAGISVFNAPSTINFAQTSLNNTTTVPFNLTPDKGYTVSAASGSGINSPFGFDFGNCTSIGTVSCTANESFTPAAPDASLASLNVFECPDVGGDCIAKGLALAGTGVSVFQGGNLAFGDVVVGSSSTLPINLTPDKGYTVSAASGSGINPPFDFDFGNCATVGITSCSADESFNPSDFALSQASIDIFECPDVGGDCFPANYSLSGMGVRASQSVPEPLTIAVFGAGLASVASTRRRKKKA